MHKDAKFLTNKLLIKTQSIQGFTLDHIYHCHITQIKCCEKDTVS